MTEKGRTIIEWYAANRGWHLLPNNIIVEGLSDQEYFSLASKLHLQRSGKALVGIDLAVFPPGDGDEGGTVGIQEQFPTLYYLSNESLGPGGRRLFRVVALLDGDEAGKHAAKAMEGIHRGLRRWRDIFCLCRVFPMKTRDLPGLKKHIEDDNKPWQALPVTVEDLINREILDTFFAENPQFKRHVQEHGGFYHYAVENHAKSRLRQYVKDVAVAEDLEAMIETLRAIRFYLGLEPDGIVLS